LLTSSANCSELKETFWRVFISISSLILEAIFEGRPDFGGSGIEPNFPKY
jgi:hypothetical protein